MTLVPYLVFAAVALLAIGFVAVPLWRQKNARMPKKARLLLLGAAALFLLGVGGGSYIILGQPRLALRSVRPADQNDVNGLIGLLVTRVRQMPDDAVAWAYLGRGYMAARDPGDAAKAFGRAIQVEFAHGRKDPSLYSAYGESLVEQSGGAIPPEAEAAFTTALALDPKDTASRFFLGQARAVHGDRQGARDMWTSLLADVPTASPLHQILVDRVALMTGAAGGAPDIGAMVAGLAARLKANPHDAAGWERLIRAYAVLGDPGKAKESLATARKTFAGDAASLAAINAQAHELKLD